MPNSFYAVSEPTAPEVLDSFACRTLRSIAHMPRLRGARVVIVGIHPEVAFAMVQLGLDLGGRTALDLEGGLVVLPISETDRESYLCETQ